MELTFFGNPSVADGIVALCAALALLVTAYQEWTRFHQRRPRLFVNVYILTMDAKFQPKAMERVASSCEDFSGWNMQNVDPVLLGIDLVNAGDQPVTIKRNADLVSQRGVGFSVPNFRGEFLLQIAPGTAREVWIPYGYVIGQAKGVGATDRMQIQFKDLLG